MIGYLKGKVAFLHTDYVLLDVHNVGYRVFISDATRQKLTLKEETQLFTYLNVREDALQLYGFATQDEYDVFQLLISVSGIGPKVALGMLSHISVAKLCQAIQLKETAVLTKLPGIGKKTAERLVLELKDKVTIGADDVKDDSFTGSTIQLLDDNISEVQAALTSLGYSASEILPILKKVDTNQPIEQIIKSALKEFNRL